MKKQLLLKTLELQQEITKKSTRQDIISVVSKLVDKHFNDNDDIKGLSPTRNGCGYNLGDVVEVIAHKIFNGNTERTSSAQHCDIITKNGKKIEVKFSTSDAYAHEINTSEKVDYYLLITYTKKEGGRCFAIPYANRREIKVNNQNRVVTDQNIKFLDRPLTRVVFAA